MERRKERRSGDGSRRLPLIVRTRIDARARRLLRPPHDPPCAVPSALDATSPRT